MLRSWLIEHKCNVRINAARITIENESKVIKHKHQNRATARGALLFWESELESCEVLPPQQGRLVVGFPILLHFQGGSRLHAVAGIHRSQDEGASDKK